LKKHDSHIENTEREKTLSYSYIRKTFHKF
jgi:hypothetical protein